MGLLLKDSEEELLLKDPEEELLLRLAKDYTESVTIQNLLLYRICYKALGGPHKLAVQPSSFQNIFKRLVLETLKSYRPVRPTKRM